MKHMSTYVNNALEHLCNTIQNCLDENPCQVYRKRITINPYITQAINLLPFSVCIEDYNLRYIAANQYSCQYIIGLPESQVIGKYNNDFINLTTCSVSKTQLRSWQDKKEESLDTLNLLSSTSEAFLNHDGNIIAQISKHIPLIDKRGHAIATLAISIDDTFSLSYWQIKRTLQKLIPKKKEAHEKLLSHLFEEKSTPLFLAITPRELDTLVLLAKGGSAQQVATMLHLSIRTIDFYKRNLFDKLLCNSKAELLSLFWSSLSVSSF